jgi:hypothetical protein
MLTLRGDSVFGCVCFTPRYSQYPPRLQDVFRFAPPPGSTTRCAEMAEKIVVSHAVASVTSYGTGRRHS